MTSSTSKTSRWIPFAIIAGGLVLWSGMFALGAYLELGADRPDELEVRRIQKALIILGCMAAFLSFWGALLWLRAGRINRSGGKRQGNDGPT